MSVLPPDLPSSGFLGKEPSLISGGSVALGTMAVNAVISYGVPITPDLKLLLVGLFGVVAPALAGFIIRSRVFSPATMAQLKSHWIGLAATPPPSQPPTIR